jgi:hypothetical protein
VEWVTIGWFYVVLFGAGNCISGSDVSLLAVSNSTGGCDVDLCRVGTCMIECDVVQMKVGNSTCGSDESLCGMGNYGWV